jgi:hypothetical protein
MKKIVLCFFVFIMLFYNCKDSNKQLSSEESFVYNWSIQNEFRIDSFVLISSKQKHKIKETPNYKLFYLFFGDGIEFLKVEVEDTSFYFAIKPNLDFKKNIKSLNQTLIDISRFREFLLLRRISITEVNDLVKFITLNGIIGLPRLYKENRMEISTGKAFFFNLQYYQMIKNSTSLSTFYDRINNDKIYWIYQSYMDSLWKKQINDVILRKRNEISKNVIENKDNCKNFYQEIKSNYNSDTNYFFYTMPDFFLYKLSIGKKIILKYYNDKKNWYSIYYPNQDTSLINFD